MSTPQKCEWCGLFHGDQKCYLVKAIEYEGTFVKRVEFFSTAEMMGGSTFRAIPAAAPDLKLGSTGGFISHQICQSCQGKGAHLNGSLVTICETCNGSGQVART